MLQFDNGGEENRNGSKNGRRRWVDCFKMWKGEARMKDVQSKTVETIFEPVPEESTAKYNKRTHTSL